MAPFSPLSRCYQDAPRGAGPAIPDRREPAIGRCALGFPISERYPAQPFGAKIEFQAVAATRPGASRIGGT